MQRAELEEVAAVLVVLDVPVELVAGVESRAAELTRPGERAGYVSFARRISLDRDCALAFNHAGSQMQS